MAAALDELLEFIVKSLVSEPDEVRIEKGERRGEPALVMHVAQADRGAVIGRSGRNIRAIETVINAAARGRPPALEVAD